jgi:four helix bundle protein
MKYTSFEELPCWQKARELCQAVFSLIQTRPFSVDFSLKDQIWRSSGSAMDNIAEGFDADSGKEFLRFLGYSQRSCSEVQSQLYRAFDCQYISDEQFDFVYNLAQDCRKQVKNFRRYLKNYV